MTSKTVGIIGGGVSGLAAGIRLAQDGIRVRLFESRSQIGGCCSTTTIDGYTFNDGAMYLAIPGILDHAFARLGLNRAELVPLVKISAPLTTYLPDGTQVVFGGGEDAYLLRPDGQRIEIDLSQLIARWRPLLQLFAEHLLLEPFSFTRFLAQAWKYLPRMRGTVADELTRLFPDETVRTAMAGVLLYTGLPASQTPVFQILGLVCMFTEGFFVPAKGMGQITDCLASVLRDAGGEIHTGRVVSRIRTHGSRAVALEMEDGETVDVDAVISAVSGMHTARLLGDAAPRGMRRKAERSPLSHRAVAVQLGLKNRIDVPSHSMTILPWFQEQQQFFEQDVSDLRYFNYTVPTVTLPDLAPPGGSIIEMFPTIRQDMPVDAWDEAATAKVADTAIAALERRHQLDIAVKRVIGPAQYRDDMGLYEGAIYGLSPSADPGKLFAAATKVPGLFQAGQTSYPGYGVSSSALSGVFAADAVLQGKNK